MKRIICVLVIAALLLAGCAAPAQPEEAKPMVSMYDLRVSMTDKAPSLPEMNAVSNSDENAAELFGYLSDLDYEKVEGYFLSYAAAGEAYEIAVVCLKDAADVPSLEDSLKAHVDGRVNLYKNYAPERVQQAQAARIVSEGRYTALIMCDEQDAVQAAFEAGVR